MCVFDCIVLCCYHYGVIKHDDDHYDMSDGDDMCRAVNNDLLDTYQLKSLDAVLEVPVEKLKFRRIGDKYFVYVDGVKLSYSSTSNVTDRDSVTFGATTVDYDNFPLREPYDRIIRCLGFKFNESLFSQSVSTSTTSVAYVAVEI